MVTQKEYHTNMINVCETFGFKYDDIAHVLQETNSYIWGPAKDYVLRKPDGKPFLNPVIHVKSPHTEDPASCYAIRTRWYHTLAILGFTRIRLAPEETAVRIAEYMAMTRKDPDVEVRSDTKQRIHCIDVYLHGSSRREIQILGTIYI